MGFSFVGYQLLVNNGFQLPMNHPRFAQAQLRWLFCSITLYDT